MHHCCGIIFPWRRRQPLHFINLSVVLRTTVFWNHVDLNVTYNFILLVIFLCTRPSCKPPYCCVRLACLLNKFDNNNNNNCLLVRIDNKRHIKRKRKSIAENLAYPFWQYFDMNVNKRKNYTCLALWKHYVNLLSAFDP